MYSSATKNLALVISGIIVAFLIIEVVMRLFGWWYLYLQENRNQVGATIGENIVIICIGESTTALGGANSWPRQLERILNNIQSDRTFRVINRGISGVTTGQILKTLPQYLNKYKPTYVLAMVGINDETIDTVTNIDSLPVSRSLDQSSFDTSLQHLRTYKLIRWITTSLRSRITGTTANELTQIEPRDRNFELIDAEFQLSNKYSPLTTSNLNSMVNITTEFGSKFIFVQYALTKTDYLQSIIQHDVPYISSYDIFKEALEEYNYKDLFTDNFAGHFGHATQFGNKLLANNIARELLILIGLQKQ